MRAVAATVWAAMVRAAVAATVRAMAAMVRAVAAMVWAVAAMVWAVAAMVRAVAAMAEVQTCHRAHILSSRDLRAYQRLPLLLRSLNRVPRLAVAGNTY